MFNARSLRCPALLFASLLIPITALLSAPPSDNVTGENQFGDSIALFSTLAAINAAGYDAGMDSPLNQRFMVRTQIREELSKRNIPCLPELKSFYKEHSKANSTDELSQYVSFALVVGPAPAFTLGDQVPPDVEPLRPFGALLARFYKEANLEDLWNRSRKAYDTAIAEYQDPVIGSIFEANGYVRNSSGYLGRRFQVFLDLLGEPDQAHVRSYRDDYYVVITPSSTPEVDVIRDAYLAYLLDPLTFKYTEVIKEKRPLEKYAQDAPALDLQYKDDFSLLLTKSLIKAIDARLMHEGAEKRAAAVNEAMREGFILSAAFADLLPAYEKQGEPLRIYYPDMVAAIDVRKESKRIKTVEFVQSAPKKVIAPPSVMQISPAEASLESAEGLYEQADYDNAAKVFKKALEQTSDKAMQGRAYYGLARVAVRQNKKDEAVDLFERTAAANPNPAITAWAHVYLGRLALAAGDADRANGQFKLALAIDGASAMAREAAEKGLQTSSSGDKKQ